MKKCALFLCHPLALCQSFSLSIRSGGRSCAPRTCTDITNSHAFSFPESCRSKCRSGSVAKKRSRPVSFLSASTLGDDPHSHLGFHVLHPEIRQGYQSSSLSVASLDINDFDFSVNVSEYYTPAPSTCASRACQIAPLATCAPQPPTPAPAASRPAPQRMPRPGP